MALCPRTISYTWYRGLEFKQNIEGIHENSRKLKWLESARQGPEEKGAAQREGVQESESEYAMSF